MNPFHSQVLEIGFSPILNTYFPHGYFILIHSLHTFYLHVFTRFLSKPLSECKCAIHTKPKAWYAIATLNPNPSQKPHPRSTSSSSSSAFLLDRFIASPLLPPLEEYRCVNSCKDSLASSYKSKSSS